MAGYLAAGTHFLDQRTRRFKHIAQVAAGIVGSEIQKARQAKGRYGLPPLPAERYVRKFTKPSEHTYLRGRYWLHGYHHHEPRIFHYRKGRLRQVSRAKMPRRKSYRKSGYKKSYARRTSRRRYKKADYAAARTEKKFKDTERDGVAFATTWAPMEDTTQKTLSAVELIPTESGRVGRAYYIESVHITGEVFMNSQTAQTTPRPQVYVRLSLVLDKQTNGAQLLGSNVYDESGSKNWLAFRNLQFTQRFSILKTRTLIIKPELTPQGTANQFANGSPSIPFKFHHIFKTPLKVICSADDDVIASITDNSLHLMGVSSNSLALLHMQSRIRFTD